MVRGVSLVSLVAVLLCAASSGAEAEASRHSLQGSTEQAADAPGWNGRLPDGVDARTLTGAGSRVGLDSDYSGAGVGYGDRGNRLRFGFDSGPCGWTGGAALPGSSHSAGSIGGGTFRSTVRCADGAPGLPLRERGTAAWRYDLAPPYRAPYDDRYLR